MSRKGFTRFIGVLYEAKFYYPDLRAGQIISNAICQWNSRPENPQFMFENRQPDPYYIEDEMLADIIDEYIRPKKEG